MKSLITTLVLICIIFSTALDAQVAGNGGNTSGSSGYSPQSPEVRLLDSVYRYDWDAHNSLWILTQKQFKIKNNIGQLADDQTLIFDSLTSSWVVTRRMLYQYFAGSDSVSIQIGKILNTQVDTFVTYSYTHYAKPGLVDETFLKSWDPSTHQFSAGSRTLTTYNSSDSVTEVLQQVLNLSTQAWVNATRETNSHDASGNLTSRLLETWVASFSTWLNNYRWNFSHDPYGNLTGILEENWDLQGSSWMNAARTTLYVRGNGQVDSLQKDTWIPVSQTWLPENRSSFIYSTEGLPYQRKDQVWQTSQQSWIDHYLTLYTYFNPTALIKSITGEFWKPTTFNWIKDAFYQNDSAGHEIENYEKYWDPNTYAFTGGFREAWEYNAAGNKTRFFIQNYDPGIGTWANSFQDLYSYDSESKLTEDLYQVWDAGLDDYTNSRKIDYFYNEFIGINEIGNFSSCIHENPLHPGSSVTCPSLDPGKTYDLSLYSATGNPVFRVSFRGGNPVQIGQGLPAGLYVMTVRSEGKIVYRDKIVLVK